MMTSIVRRQLITWLVVSTPLKNISQLGLLFLIYGKIKNVPNHQPVTIRGNRTRSHVFRRPVEPWSIGAAHPRKGWCADSAASWVFPTATGPTRDPPGVTKFGSEPSAKVSISKVDQVPERMTSSQGAPVR